MRYISFLIIVAALTACNSKTENNEEISSTVIETDNPAVESAKMEFEEMVWDFGEIIEGERVVHTFKFKNVGNNHLSINSATASCGCTIPEWPKEPIPPGGEGSIKVQFNSNGKVGTQHKDITIISNADPVKTVLQIKAQVQKKK